MRRGQLLSCGVGIIVALIGAGCGKKAGPVAGPVGNTGTMTSPKSPEERQDEVKDNILKIYEGARAYWDEGTAGPAGQAKTFPKSVSMPPDSCCNSPSKLCEPDPARWADPTWQALKFSIEEPTPYVYSFLSAGTDVTSMFTVRANGDVDCDGAYSTFEIVGSIQADGTVTGVAGFFTDQANE
jgi:hypothetical protein